MILGHLLGILVIIIDLHADILRFNKRRRIIVPQTRSPCKQGDIESYKVALDIIYALHRNRTKVECSKSKHTVSPTAACSVVRSTSLKKPVPASLTTRQGRLVGPALFSSKTSKI